MKPIIFKHHALVKIAERELRLGWIERAARTPDWIEPEPHDSTVERRFARTPEFGGRVLRVAVRETIAEICVISVHFDRGARRRHARKHIRP
jgi:hypothetical protein